MLSALAYKKGQGEFLIMKQFMKEYGGWTYVNTLDTKS